MQVLHASATRGRLLCSCSVLVVMSASSAHFKTMETGEAVDVTMLGHEAKPAPNTPNTRVRSPRST